MEDQESARLSLSLMSHRTKLVQTVWLGLGIATCGMCLTLRGTALLDLQRLTSSSLAQISAAIFTGVSAGWIVGGVGGGALLDRYNQQVLMAVCGAGSGIFTALIPVFPNIVILSLSSTMSGVFISAYDAGCLALCLQLWGQKAGPYMQTLDLVFALGCVGAPLFVEGLLQLSHRHYKNTAQLSQIINASNLNSSEYMSNLSQVFELSNAQNVTDLSKTTPAITYGQNNINNVSVNISGAIFKNETCGSSKSSYEENHLYWWAYIVFGALACLSGIPFAVNACCKIQLDKSQESGVAHKNKTASERNFMIKVLILLAVFSLFYNAVEDICAGLMKTFAVKHLCWSDSQGNKLLSVYWGTYTLARVIGIVETFHLHPGTIVLIHGTALTLSFYILLSVNAFEYIMWIAAAFMGIAIAPIFTARINWTNCFVKVSGKVMGFIFVMEGVGSMIWPPIVGVLVDKYGAMCFVYLLCIFGTVMMILFSVMHFIAMRHGSRFSDKNDKDFNQLKAKDEFEMESLKENKQENRQENTNGINHVLGTLA